MVAELIGMVWVMMNNWEGSNRNAVAALTAASVPRVPAVAHSILFQLGWTDCDFQAFGHVLLNSLCDYVYN